MPVQSLSELLGKIREKPGMYVGNGGVEDLHNLLSGYRMGICDSEVDIPDDWGMLEGFHEFVSQELGFRNVSSIGWPAQVWMASFSSPSGSRELFFTLWDRYAAGWGRQVKKRARKKRATKLRP